VAERDARMLATICPFWPNCVNKVRSHQGVDVLRLSFLVAWVKRTRSGDLRHWCPLPMAGGYELDDT